MDSKKTVAIDQGKFLRGAAWPGRRDPCRGGGLWAARGPQAKAWRHPVFKDFKNELAGERLHQVRLIMLVIVVAAMAMAVVMSAAAQKPGTGNIHRKTHTGNRDGFCEVNLDWREQAGHRLVTDQECDHGQHNGAGKAGEIAEFAGAEGKARIRRMAPRVRVGKRRQEQGAGMSTHVQSVRHQRDRTKQEAAYNLGDHHCPAQPDHSPGFALTLCMRFAQKDVLMGNWLRGRSINI